MERYERLNSRLTGLNLLCGKASMNVSHNKVMFYIAEHTENKQFIEKEAMQTVLQTGIDTVFFYGAKKSLWHLMFDEMDIKIHGDSEKVLLTCGCNTIEDFVDELTEELTIRTFVPLDCYLVYDDKNIYEDIKRRLRDRNLINI